jgi:hypothetical protein
MISYSQDWARILYVGDTLFCIVTCNVLDDDSDKEVPCVHIEFRWDNRPHHVFKICEDEQEQRSYFETIDETTLHGIMLEHLEY